MEKINVNALFLGPKAENENFFRDMLNFMINDHIGWRKYFHPDDKSSEVSDEIENKTKQDTLLRTREALIELAANLQIDSVPWFSPRYLGHMTTDTFMAALLGYMLTLLYNPNNCAYEASPATTPMEIEVGKQLAAMMGYNPVSAWGHITSGGTVANYESMWVARNVKSIPFAMRKVMPELVTELNEWQLANLDDDTIMEMLDLVRKAGRFDDVRSASVRGEGIPAKGLGKWIVPQSKHYSWVKAADILGIGQHNLEFIKVKNNYRLDIEDLKKTIDHLIEQQTPILGVVAVVGTTEEGAIDEVDKVISLREEYKKKKIWFHIHIDSAYGGYARAIFLNENNQLLQYNDLRKKLIEESLMNDECDWLSPDVYNAFKAMAEADSITVDPHKMGYIPYSAGAVLFKDRRVLDTISYFAAYVFEKEEKNPMLLGSYIMEGSKAGAVVASVWTAHKVVPLNITGYGKLISNSIVGAHRFLNSLNANATLKIKNRDINVYALTRPDLNIIIYSFNEKENKDLKRMNSFNQKIYEKFSYRSGPVYATDYIMSKTSLSHEEYGDMPYDFVKKFGIEFSEWEKVHEVFVLRSCIMTPLLAQGDYKQYWEDFFHSLKVKIAEIFGE